MGHFVQGVQTPPATNVMLRIRAAPNTGKAGLRLTHRCPSEGCKGTTCPPAVPPAALLLAYLGLNIPLLTLMGSKAECGCLLQAAVKMHVSQAGLHQARSRLVVGTV